MHTAELWAGRGWPLTDDDHEFLVPAFNRIGRHLHGEDWRDHYPSLEPLQVNARTVEEASPEERAWAHRVLFALAPDTYQEDYEEPPPQLGTLAALGAGHLPAYGGSLNTLGRSEILEPSRRASGWWFSKSDWERFRTAIHYQNELQKPRLAMVDEAARWLFNRVVRREIIPCAQHRLSGGQWQETSIDDWRMPNADRLRSRIRNCALTPGHPAAPGGLFWIVINKAELDAALARTSSEADSSDSQRPFLAPSSASAVGVSLDPAESSDPMTARQIGKATDFARAALIADKTWKRNTLLAKTREAIGFVSENQWRSTIWPTAREQAGLERSARAGRPRKSVG